MVKQYGELVTEELNAEKLCYLSYIWLHETQLEVLVIVAVSIQACIVAIPIQAHARMCTQTNK